MSNLLEYLLFWTNYSKYQEYLRETARRRANNVPPESTEEILRKMGIGIDIKQDKRKLFDQQYVIDIAKEMFGSSAWNKYGDHGIFYWSTPKCNIFVYEVLVAAGAKVPLLGGSMGKETNGAYGVPPLAQDWADKNLEIPGWQIVAEPMPGDVVSTGTHVGFYAGDGKILSATPMKGVTTTDLDPKDTLVFRRYVGTLYEQVKFEVLQEMGFI